ncbi:hypothetical protein [Fructobacillus fructosus]|uniref:Uncharacterized protein n=1 Tax=Fructobacillus fructosus TaxID=1631 RepID=A0ABM9MP21_9LACO|nr:hypothetical protein [Fructobacillus fructosus]MBC9118384.1 hypothetical protein [Fructobacillus fructosus]MBD9364605.1 hypothetical protein [Leuconostoc mesenteroides]CAK1229839.1 unnamed protein product [Fructobacillus fructosus]
MENLDQAIEKYAQKKQRTHDRILENTNLNQEVIQASLADRAIQKSIKIRELKSNPLPYSRHMKWMTEAKG